MPVDLLLSASRHINGLVCNVVWHTHCNRERMIFVGAAMKETSDDRGLSDIAWAIRRYLDAHPNAADSMDGIMRWWLTRQRYADTASNVQEALDQLEAHGLISRTHLSDGKVVYQRVPPRDTHNGAF